MEVLSSAKLSLLSGWGGLVDLSLVSDSVTVKSTEPHIRQLEPNPSNVHFLLLNISKYIHIKYF